jgi:hypothetical protein
MAHNIDKASTLNLGGVGTVDLELAKMKGRLDPDRPVITSFLIFFIRK